MRGAPPSPGNHHINHHMWLCLLTSSASSFVITPATDRSAGGKEQMTGTTRIHGDRQEGGRYEIRLKGHLDSRWAAWFDGLSLTHESDGTTVIHCQIVDQAALHGVLQKVRDVGLPLVSVEQVADHPPDQVNPGAQERTTPRQGD